MAAIYSLICWGGATGKSVTASSATSRVTLASHGLRDGKGVQFTSGTLPTVSGAALALDTTYYVGVHSTSEFRLYYDEARTSQVLFTSNGSGLVLKGAYYQGLSDTSRWGARIYDGLAAWNSARSSASAFDTEVAEIGEAFTDTLTTDLDLSVPAAVLRVESKIDGVLTEAHHGGNVETAIGSLEISNGYVLYTNTSPTAFHLKLSRRRTTVSGIVVLYDVNNTKIICDLGVQTQIADSVIASGFTQKSTGVFLRFGFSSVVNSVIYNTALAVQMSSSQDALTVANCTIVGNINAFSAASTVRGYIYNNLVAGNGTDWPTIPTSLNEATNNSGPTGSTPWQTAGGSSYVVETTDLANYAGRDFRPASVSSPQVDTGALFYEYPEIDLSGSVQRPSYENGAPTSIDIGAFEFDHGFGPWPVNVTLTLTGLQAGSDIVILDAGTTTERVNVDANAGTTYAYAYTATGDVDIGVFKAGFVPFYIRGFTLSGVNASLPIAQVPDRAYSNP